MPRNIPLSPLGQPGGLAPTWSVAAGPGWEASGWEQNPDLRFPYSVHVYDRMRRTEGQIASVIRAMTLPIRKAAWSLKTDGVDPAVASFVADEINIDGTAGIHLTGGLDLPEHIREALLALWWGFAPFEVTYTPGPARTPGAPSTVYHLARLMLRPPITLSELRADPATGDLVGVVQMPAGYDAPLGNVIGGARVSAVSPVDVFIPANRLLFYCHEREGADWSGTSLMRASYMPWLLKDDAVRAMAAGVARNSMGIPTVYYGEEGSEAKALAMAEAVRTGQTAGLAMKDGEFRLEITGMSGSRVDPVPIIEYFDRLISRSMLAMFLDLGHDAGARSLGETFADFFADSLNAVASWIAVTFTKTVIRQLVDINFGPGRPIPVLTCAEITPGASATAEAVSTLVTAGVITADEALETQQRRAYGLPERTGPTPAPAQDSVGEGEASPMPGEPVGGGAPGGSRPAADPATLRDAAASGIPREVALDRLAALADRIAALREA